MIALRCLACAVAIMTLGAFSAPGVSKDVTGTAPVVARGPVSLTTSVGDISVNTWSNPAVRWVAHEHAADPADLARLSLQVTRDAGGLSVTAIPFAGCEDCGIDLSVWVPKTASVTASSAHADVDINGVSNGVIVRVERGDIQIEAANGDVVAQTEVGDVSVRVPRLADTRKISLRSIVGNVRLQLPRSAAATITASTAIGEIRSDFGTPQTRMTSQALQTKTGSGDVKVNIGTHTGDVDVLAL
ncbi:MAG TPA: DUF4097 family beta strand repeat-containing protein [Candidatus Acidoferrales bacterium]|nr:DUF4097 family beta strand repeat-containing protein [Candidatus Acidoferrales bacterium]